MDEPSKSPEFKPPEHNVAGPGDPVAFADVSASGRRRHDTNELYRLLVETVRDYAIFALDRTGHVLTWNPGAERFKGYKAHEIIGKHFSIFYPPEDLAADKPGRELEIAAREGRVEDEGWRIRKDGTRFWAFVVITALRDATGELIGFAKVTRDLTERRMAEEHLRQSEERLRLIIQNVRDYGIFMLDTSGMIMSWNEGARLMYGYKADDIIGHHFSQFYTAEDLADDKPARELRIAEQVGRYEDETGWRIRKDGTRVWANVIITPLRDESGTLVGFVKVTRDLTERAARVSAEHTADQAARLQRVTAALAGTVTTQQVADVTLDLGLQALDAVSGVVCLLDSDSAEVTRVWGTGYSQQTLEGFRKSALTMPLLSREVVRTRSPVYIRTQKEWTDRYLPPPGGLPVPPSAAGVPLLVGDRLVGLMVLRYGSARTFDQTERALILNVANQCAQALERARLHEAERAARARADDANRAKTDFLAVMSHELRTPLNAIAGYAELLEIGVHGPLTDAQRDAVRRLQRSQRHLLGLINDVLNFARIDAGHIEVSFENVPVRETLLALEALVAPQVRTKLLHYSFDDVSTALTVRADPEKLRQVLLNLLANAIKFTEPGGTIRVSCTANEDTVGISVSDTGPGIEPDKLERIFEPFVQLDIGRTRKHEGTGLGLAISRDLAHAMGGDVAVESRVGQGSTFTLTIPRAVV